MILKYDDITGLLPVVVQDADSGSVLMVGYMNSDAYDTTMTTRRVTFFSRSRQELWMKGETSGNVLNVVSIHADCDADALLIKARPAGPTCHTGSQSCFDDQDAAFRLADLEDIIDLRDASGDQHSYTVRLLREGIHRCAQKVGEEGLEVALAAVAAPDQLVDEVADLLYHILVLLHVRGHRFSEVEERLASRNGRRMTVTPS